jgi:uncharacterized membrane protein (DUF485 family)
MRAILPRPETLLIASAFPAVTGIPLGLLLLLMTFVFTMRRALHDRETP